MSRPVVDLTGKRFGALLVLKPTGERRNNSVVWRCLCDCGKRTSVTHANLSKESGGTRSCGCLQHVVRAGAAELHPCAACGDRCLSTPPFEPDRHGIVMAPICARPACVRAWALALAVELGVEGARRAATSVQTVRQSMEAA